jgi:membrane protease YdiL (CAAX protease family)
MKVFIQRHSLLAYFTLAFAVSWGCVLVVVGSGGFPASAEQAKKLLPFVVLAMWPGPTVAGILLTGLVYGRTGLRELLSRLGRCRVAVRWYAVALLTAPILVMATLLALSLTSSAFLPGILTTNDRLSLLLVSIGYGLGTSFFEELGWTGFAVPRMRLRYGVLATGIIVGVLWGAWHYLTNFWGSGDSSGELTMAIFLPAQLFAILVLPAYRVLMVWVYDHTGSLLVAMLMHASLTASWLIVMPQGISGVPFFIWYLALAVALWIMVAIVAVSNRGRLS